MGNTPPHTKRQLDKDSYSTSFSGYDSRDFYLSNAKRRSLPMNKKSVRRNSDVRAPTVSSCVEAMDNDEISRMSSMLKNTDISQSTAVAQNKKERSNSCTLMFPMDSISTGGSHLNMPHSKASSSVGDEEPENMSISGEAQEPQLIPTVFRWKGGGNDISISGTFNNWSEKIPMARCHSGACIIINCPAGEHEYKYFIDGAWYHDPTKPFKENQFCTKNNILVVRPEDSNVLTALNEDIANSKHQAVEDSSSNLMGQSPPGDYGQMVPPNPDNFAHHINDLYSPGSYKSNSSPGKICKPPFLPPQLVQAILNCDTGVHCDPNLLPSPNHVIVNHMYALSIKNGVVVLSVVHRFRQKFVSTLFYKPIKG